MIPIETPNKNMFNNGVNRIRYELLIETAEKEQVGLGESFKHLAPDTASTLKETERRKSEIVDTYLHASSQGVLLADMPVDKCYLDVSCDNDLSEWTEGAGTCCGGDEPTEDKNYVTSYINRSDRTQGVPPDQFEVLPSTAGIGDTAAINLGTDNSVTEYWVYREGTGNPPTAPGWQLDSTVYHENTGLEYVNVKDFGAKGDTTYSGTTVSWGHDDTLAIHKAIEYACGSKSYDEVMAMTYTSETKYVFGVTMPRLLATAQGDTRVYFPPGIYRVTSPILIQHGHYLDFDKDARIIPDYRAEEDYPMTRDEVVYQYEDDFPPFENDPTHRRDIGGDGEFTVIQDYMHYNAIKSPYIMEKHDIWNANCQVQKAYIRVVNPDLKENGGHLMDSKVYLPHPYGTVSPLRVKPEIGGTKMNVFTYSNASVAAESGLHVGDKIKLWIGRAGDDSEGAGGPGEGETVPQIHTITAMDSTSITVEDPIDPPPSNPNGNFSDGNCHFLLEESAANGLTLSGGESMEVGHSFFLNFKYGHGTYCPAQSPAFVINNCMSGLNKIGHRIETYPAEMYSTSGDTNQIYVQAGRYRYVNLSCHGLKMERLNFDPDFPVIAQFDFGSLPSGPPSQYAIRGGILNDQETRGSAFNDIPLIRLTEYTTSAQITIEHLRNQSFGGWTVKRYYRHTPDILDMRKSIPIRGLTDNSTRIIGSTHSPYVSATVTGDEYPPTNVRLTDRGTIAGNRWTGSAEVLDCGSGLLNIPVARYLRSGTSVTVTTTNSVEDGGGEYAHGLFVGDFVRPFDEIEDEPITGDHGSPWKYSTSGDDLTDDSWRTGFFRIQSITTNTFTIEVLEDYGHLSGTCSFEANNKTITQQVYRGELRFQIPGIGGNPYTGDSRTVGIYNKEVDHLWGLSTNANLKKGDMWVSGNIEVGGTIGAPHSIITPSSTTGITHNLTNVGGALGPVPNKWYVDDAAALAGGVAIGQCYLQTGYGLATRMV